jgi:hypothetical protein
MALVKGYPNGPTGYPAGPTVPCSSSAHRMSTQAEFIRSQLSERPRWQELLPHLPESLPVIAVAEMNNNEFTQCFPPGQSKLLALELIMAVKSQADRPAHQLEEVVPPVTRKKPLLFLNGAGRVIPDAFAKFEDTGMMTITNFQKFIGDPAKSPFVGLSIARNHLSDPSLLTFVPFFAAMPKLQVLDLSQNYFSPAVLSAICPLLQKEPPVIVVIHGNPAASMEARDAFESLPTEEFLRLVWIPQHWLEARLWTVCLGTEKGKLANAIYNAHSRFFSQSSYYTNDD